MILLTLLDNQVVVLNSDTIASIAARPDTTIHLSSGSCLVVRESPQQVVDKIVEFRAQVLKSAWPERRDYLNEYGPAKPCLEPSPSAALPASSPSP